MGVADLAGGVGRREGAERVVEEGDCKLDGERGGDGGEAWARGGALLVEGAVARRVGGRHDVVAEVASQVALRRVARARVRGGALRGVGDAVAQEHEGVEPQSNVHAELVFGGADDRGKPARLSGVCEEEDKLGCLDQRLQPPHVRKHALLLLRRDRVAGHGDGERVGGCLDIGHDPLESVCGCLGLGFAFRGVFRVDAILVLEEPLPRRVAVAHLPVVHQRDFPEAPG
mmetsp:Transcript_32188/g.49896  ORF Transcript_32188/g.49896 Transcript_32188/m.49896 type:complete len:229 (-) Transcript_32188:1091-1777(-)